MSDDISLKNLYHQSRDFTVTINITVLWKVPYSLIEIQEYFGGTCHHHLWGRFQTGCMALRPTRYYSSWSMNWEPQITRAILWLSL